ncbi:MAG TPA: ATP-binding protein [Rhizomicrobium sp.]|nr:ATP-binding protein [Rhizomicrobium sp.]
MTAARQTIARWLFAVAVLATPVAHAATLTASDHWRVYKQDTANAMTAMMSDPQKALDSALAALAQIHDLPPSPRKRIAEITGTWLQSEALFRLDQAPKAIPLVNSVLPDALRLGPESKLAGALMLVHGRLSSATGSVQTALADYQRAYDIYGKANDPRHQAIALQQIGWLYQDAHDYPRMLQYYKQASEIYGSDPALDLAAHNNIARALKAMGRYSDAATEFGRALGIARKLDSPSLEVQILDNIASSQIADGDLRAAEASVDEAFRIAAKNKSAATEEPFLRGERAIIAFRRGDLAKAKDAIERAFAHTDLGKTDPQYLDFHKAAFDIYTKLGDDHHALLHLKAYKRLADAARDLAASTNSALMSAKFDFENQNLKIARLRTQELEKTAQLARSREQERVAISETVGGAGAILLLIITYSLIAMRRSRNEVRAINTKLEASNTALQKALKAKAEFLATTSHEIRTPLNGILGMTEVLLTDKELSSSARERLKLVHASSEQMRALVDDLLDVVKTESGALTIDKQDMDLHQLLRDLATAWSDQAKAKGLDLQLSFARAPRRIVEDEKRLQQIVQNLVSNAVKFTDRGGVRIEALEAGEARLVIKVTDSGIGVAPEDQSRIFEPFTQVDGSVVRRFGGTGLGLAICRKLVAAMGGTIEITSALGTGSTFTVNLPLEVPEAKTDSLAADASLKDSAILAIAANPLTQSVLRMALGPHCKHLEIVPSLEAADAACREEHFALIVADGPSLPREAADLGPRLERLPSGRGKALVLNDCQAGDLSGILGGLVEILNKPVAPASLLSKLVDMRQGVHATDTGGAAVAAA